MAYNPLLVEEYPLPLNVIADPEYDPSKSDAPLPLPLNLPQTLICPGFAIDMLNGIHLHEQRQKFGLGFGLGITTQDFPVQSITPVSVVMRMRYEGRSVLNVVDSLYLSHPFIEVVGHDVAMNLLITHYQTLLLGRRNAIAFITPDMAIGSPNVSESECRGLSNDLILGVIRRSLTDNWNRWRTSNETLESDEDKAVRLIGLESVTRNILKAVC